LETKPPEPDDSTPPEGAVEEPVQPVPTRETTPVWAQTSPAAPAQKKGDPDWSKTETSANGESQKSAPPWAETVPTSPGDEVVETPEKREEADATAEPAVAASDEPVTEPPAVKTLSDPPKSVAADAMKSTWPPASSSAPAPPEETDIWPPEPPTEPAMKAWPPPSELDEPEVPAQAIPSWPDSFEPVAAAPTMPPTAPATVPPTITPNARPEAVEAFSDAPVTPVMPEPAAQGVPEPTEAPEESTFPETLTKEPEMAAAVLPEPEPEPSTPPQPAPIAPARPAPLAPAESEPVAPPQAGPPGRPAWAPGPVAEPRPSAPRDPGAPPVQVPAWAPRVPLAGETGKPTWFSPKEAIPHATAQPIAQHAEPAAPPAPAPPIVGGQLPVAPIPAAPAPAAPAHAQAGSAKSTWEVVEQQRKSAPHPKVPFPTAEDRSYAEWFAWAKRGGAPASACHAAAQGAFKALSSGKDVNTAVQWATAAMSSPPEPVTQARQGYCAWLALANIDLNLDQHRAHLFAGGAIQALEAGQDASAAHAAGLAAAGIR